MLLSHLDLRCLVWIAAGAALVGCRPQEPITRYSVPKPELIDPTLTAGGALETTTQQQMLGIIVPLGEESWFFKLMGDPAAVEPARSVFLDFVKSVKFSSGESPRPR